MKRIILALALAATAVPALAQIYVENPDWAFGENKIVYDKFNWKTYRSTHFVIYFYEKEANSLQKVASFAESAYDDISRALNFQIPKPINLIYYATHADFEQTNTLLNFIPEGVGAFALPTRNRMVLPIDMPDPKLQQLIAHELTHVFQFEMLFNGNYLRAMTTNAPQWLMEGMASYFGKDEDAKDQMVLRDAVLSDRVPEISTRQVYGYIAYRFGHAVFDFIAAEWGQDAVRDFLFEYRNQIGANIERAVKRTFNVSGEDFDIRFRRYLRQRYLKILIEKGEPTDFGERFKIEDTPSAETSPRAYPSGDFVAAISTYKDDADVVVMSTRDRKLFKNLTKGYKTAYEYIVAQWITTGPQQGADVAVSPDGNTVAVFARRERGRDLLLLDALNGDIRDRIEMPDLDQQLNPAFSPDSNLIAFHAMRGGRADIYVYNVATRTITDLTDDESFDFGPTFSPDGTWIYYSSVRGTKTKIFRLHPEAPESREQVTYGEGNDEDASLSPDGKRLFFTSDRDAGIYNIYSSPARDGRDVSAHRRRRRHLLADVASSGKTIRRSSSSRRSTRGASRSTSPTSASPCGSCRSCSRHHSRDARPDRAVPARDRSLDRPGEDHGEAVAQALSRERAGRRRRQHRPDLRLRHDPDLRRQPRRPPFHRASSVRSRPSRSSTSSTGT